MRIFILSLCLCLSTLLSGGPVTANELSPSLAIELHYPQTPGAPLEIELTASGLGEEPQIFEVVENWGGSVFAEGIIEDVVSLSQADDRSAGEEQRSPRPAELIESPHAWRLEAEKADSLRIRYALPANEHIRGLDGDLYYKPIVTDGLVHLIGQQSLLLPRAWDEDTQVHVTLRWRGLSDSTAAATSFGVGPGTHRFVASKAELRRGLYVAGQGELFEGVGQGAVQVFVASGPWRFEASEFADAAQKIVAAEREFFREQSPEPFLITAIPVGPEQPEYLSYGGTGLKNAFATFIVPLLELDEQGRGGLHYLLAHEKAHTWIGGLVASGEEPETAGYWFSEGVTDYYTPRLLHRAGLMTPTEVVEEWNGYLRRYVLSPAAEASNQQIADGFWSDRDLQQLAYMRGAAVTLFLDQTRRRRTSGEARFDHWLLGEIDQARQEGRLRRLTNDQLRAGFVGGWTEPEIQTAFETLMDGRPLALAEDILAPCATLTWHEETTFRLGLTIDESTGEILEVEEGSNAHQAGLRAGHRLGGWSIRYGRPDLEVVVQRLVENDQQSAEDGDAQGEGQRALEEVRFLPAGPSRQVPQFEVVDAEACADFM